MLGLLRKRDGYTKLLVSVEFTKYSRLPITRTFKGNRKKVRVTGSAKKIAESKVKNRFLLHSEHFNLI